MFQLIKLSFIDFYKSYKKYISFALLYMLLTSFFAVPMISFIFNRMLLMLGPGTLLNADVYKIALSLPGFVGMLLISFIVLVIYFLQFGVIIIISQKTYFSKNLLISEAW